MLIYLILLDLLRNIAVKNYFLFKDALCKLQNNNDGRQIQTEKPKNIKGLYISLTIN